MERDMKIANINDNKDEISELLSNHVLECNISDIIIDMAEDMEAYEYLCRLGDMVLDIIDKIMNLVFVSQDGATTIEIMYNLEELGKLEKYGIDCHQYSKNGFILNFPSHHQFYHDKLELVFDNLKLTYNHSKELITRLLIDSLQR